MAVVTHSMGTASAPCSGASGCAASGDLLGCDWTDPRAGRHPRGAATCSISASPRSNPIPARQCARSWWSKDNGIVPLLNLPFLGARLWLHGPRGAADGSEQGVRHTAGVQDRLHILQRRVPVPGQALLRDRGGFHHQPSTSNGRR